MRKSLATALAALLTAVPAAAPSERHEPHTHDRQTYTLTVRHHPTTSTH